MNITPQTIEYAYRLSKTTPKKRTVAFLSHGSFSGDLKYLFLSTLNTHPELNPRWVTTDPAEASVLGQHNLPVLLVDSNDYESMCPASDIRWLSEVAVVVHTYDFTEPVLNLRYQVLKALMSCAYQVAVAPLTSASHVGCQRQLPELGTDLVIRELLLRHSVDAIYCSSAAQPQYAEACPSAKQFVTYGSLETTAFQQGNFPYTFVGSSAETRMPSTPRPMVLVKSVLMRADDEEGLVAKLIELGYHVLWVVSSSVMSNITEQEHVTLISSREDLIPWMIWSSSMVTDCADEAYTFSTRSLPIVFYTPQDINYSCVGDYFEIGTRISLLDNLANALTKPATPSPKVAYRYSLKLYSDMLESFADKVV